MTQPIIGWLPAQVFKRWLPAYPMHFFAGGRALLDALPHMHRKPSLILLDRHMPDLDGHQTLLRLKGHTGYRKIRVVMMSADASRGEIDDCYEARAHSFLIKRVEFDALTQTLSAICQYWLELITDECLDKNNVYCKLIRVKRLKNRWFRLCSGHDTTGCSPYSPSH